MMALSGFKLEGIAQLALVGAALFVGYKLYKAGSAVTDAVSGAAGWVADKVTGAVDIAGEAITGATSAEVLEACRVALKAKGQNPDDFYFIFPQPTLGTKLPAGSWGVTYKNKRYYFAKKGVNPLAVFSL